MAKFNISLNIQPNPNSPMGLVQKDDDGDNYPRFHYEGPDSLEEDLGIPEKGTMTIEYEIVRETNSKEDGKEWYSCDVEVQKIVSAKASAPESPTKSGSEAGDALDKLAAEKSNESEGY
jgi:hypothetical protein